VPGLFSAEAPPLLAQPGHRAACRLPGTTVPGLRGPAMGFSRPIPGGPPSRVSGWTGTPTLRSASVSAPSPGSPGGLGSPADPGRVPRPRPRPANCPGPGLIATADQSEQSDGGNNMVSMYRGRRRAG